MIDLHSHILPQVDDGSRSTEESLQMLTALAAQGVTDVAATPHFYASENGPDRFLARRARSWQQLRPHLTASLPRVHPLRAPRPGVPRGGGVLFSGGPPALAGVPRLCLSGADTLLLEMPFRPWSQRMLDELLELADRPDVTVLLAHMERYLPYVAEPDWRRMARSGLYIQSNADFFCGFSTRRKALRLLSEGRIHVLGTDCHNMERRAPRMDEAVRVIARALGDDTVQRLEEQARRLLKKGGAA